MYGRGDLDITLEMHQKSLAVSENILVKDHISTAIPYNNIAMVMEDERN